jgi:amino acid adenylation domain-containing protein
LQWVEPWRSSKLNSSKSSYPSLLVDQLFAQVVAKMPERFAVTFEDKTLTYIALSSAAERLARRLMAIGVGPGSLVGICMDRCSEMAVAMLAVFKAGGAYLPLDPAFPAARIEFMQKDANPLVIITQRHLHGKFSFQSPHVLFLDSATSEFNSDAHPDLSPNRRSSLDDLAYVIYTSGSTGKPKGVEVTHRSLTNLLTSVVADLPVKKSDVVLATSTISFDISIFEIFAPLISGAHLVIVPRVVAMDGQLLSNAIRGSGANIVQATPSGWRLLLEAGWTGETGLKMLSAGEPLDRALARRLLQCGAELWNLYGPTEATVYATANRITSADQKITVGRPLANYTAYVLDENLLPVPTGVIGDLYLGGIGIARGYLNRPDLTAANFVPDPFGREPGRSLYRTGDLARFLPVGEIDLLGRADNQVKLRGYRIELEEIESLLESHPAVQKAVVKVIEVREGDQRLVAYFVRRNSSHVDESQLREYAVRSLPAYMAPTSYVPMAAFPLTPSGKVDRNALPIPAIAESLDAATSVPVPAHELELVVLGSWRSVLNIPDLDIDDNFFDAGGHSLLALRMFAQLSKRLGWTPPISLLAEAPTPRTFAKAFRQFRDRPATCLVSMQSEGSQPPIYFIHHSLGDILIYRALASCFASERPVVGVQPPADLTQRPQPYSMQALAAEYVEQILQQQTAGPFHLAGFSTGSVLAFEMARQLREAGHEVGLVALIDGDVKGPGPVLSKFERYGKITFRKLCKIAFKFGDEVREGPKQFVAKRLRHLWLAGRMRSLAKPSTATAGMTMEQCILLAESTYRPQPYGGSVLLLRFHNEAWKFGPDPLMGWGEVAKGDLEVVDLPGGHMTGMGPVMAPQLAALLKSRMEKAELAALPSRVGQARG